MITSDLPDRPWQIGVGRLYGFHQKSVIFRVYANFGMVFCSVDILSNIVCIQSQSHQNPIIYYLTTFSSQFPSQYIHSHITNPIILPFHSHPNPNPYNKNGVYPIQPYTIWIITNYILIQIPIQKKPIPSKSIQDLWFSSPTQN